MADGKRWAATARLGRSGRYQVEAPELATPRALLAAAVEPLTLIGFDFPIGLPRAYAAIAKIASFTKVLDELGTGLWSSFFEPATRPSEIDVFRPFYPQSPGGKKREHLVERLGLSSSEDLYRICETIGGRRACPLFWTLGANQVGKAALSGWSTVLRPARASGTVALWPFDGPFEQLIERGQTVIAETYPGDMYRLVGAALPKVDGRRGKRAQRSRAASAPGMLAWARHARVELTAALVERLREGFGDRAEGEDPFDAVVGVLGMLAVLRGDRPAGAPDWPGVRYVEGWIFGRVASTV